MAFISAKNFVAPLTSTFHVVTILLIALIFMILRWSGFGTSVYESPRVSGRPLATSPYSQQGGNLPTNLPASGSGRVPFPAVSGQSTSGAAIIDEVRRAGEPDPNAATEPTRPNSFDDIQRKLGLK